MCPRFSSVPEWGRACARGYGGLLVVLRLRSRSYPVLVEPISSGSTIAVSGYTVRMRPVYAGVWGGIGCESAVLTKL
jgi:hypothetical protein